MKNPLDTMLIAPFNQGQCENIFGSHVRGPHRDHWGWDLVADPGSSVYAISTGEITASNNDPTNATRWGRYIQLKFTYQEATHWALYAHLKVLVKSEGKVKEGDLIGYSGDSGNAKGNPQLHIEFRKTSSLKKVAAVMHISPAIFLGHAPLDSGRVCKLGS